MLSHNLKFILRSMLANKLYSGVIVLSLTAGFACATLFLSFLIAQSNTDAFHEKSDRIFQATTTDLFDDTRTMAFVVDKFADFARQFPEVEEVCQVVQFNKVTLQAGGDPQPIQQAIGVDRAFFQMFDFPLTGVPAAEAVRSNTVVVSTEKAKALFGNDDPIGKTLTFSNGDTTFLVEVSAVFQRPQGSSHLRFDAVFHRDVLPGFFGGVTYLQLTSGEVGASLAEKINASDERPSIMGPARVSYFLLTLTDAYFNTDNRFGFVKTRGETFLTVGYVACGLVLFIAAFNFVNLFLLFWYKRQKSVGVRKTFGISTAGLFRFSLGEAMMYIAIAIPLSAMLTAVVLPQFNTIFDGTVTTAFLFDTKVLIACVGVVMLAIVLMSTLATSKQVAMKPVIQMKGGPGASSSRTSLLFIVQFVVSIALVIGAVTVTMQMRFLENAPLGFNRHLIHIHSPTQEGEQLMPALKTLALQIPGVANAVISSGNPISHNMVARYDMDDGAFYTPYVFTGDEGFFKALNLELIAGEIPTQEGNGRVVNETLIRQFQVTDPIGKNVPGRSEEYIVGVVRDFTIGSFKNDIPPVVISYSPVGRALLIDYASENTSNPDALAVIPQLASAWQKIFPDQPFEYFIIQNELMKKYKEDTALFKMVVSMAVITMMLSCFGLFAMSWAVTQSRAKELSIRKVLGATIGDVLTLLMAAFSRRILIAFFIAAPISYYIADMWLTTFTNRITVNAWTFVIALVVVAAIALVTMGVHMLKAARVNPVEEMRME